MSALLLQLVQTSPHFLRFECHSLAKQRRYAPTQGKEFECSEIDRTVRQLCAGTDFSHLCLGDEPLLERAGLCSQSRTNHRGLSHSEVDLPLQWTGTLTKRRSGKTKAAKSSNEAEYRAILDNLVADLLTVLYLPEWPAAALLLGVLTRLFVSICGWRIYFIYTVTGCITRRCEDKRQPG